MKRETKGTTSFLLFIYRLLILLVAAFAVFTAGATFFALASGKTGQKTASPDNKPGSLAPESPTLSQNVNGGYTEASFTGIGRLRIANASIPPATIIITIVFPYNREDRPFFEELVAKTDYFRTVIKDLFSNTSTESLQGGDVTLIKDRLVTQFNDELRLGQIETIYFEEYLIIE